MWLFKWIKLFSYLLLAPGELFWGILPIFVYRYFLCFYIFCKAFSCLLSNFLQVFSVIPHSGNFFITYPPLLGAIWRYFGSYFWLCSSIHENFPAFHLMKSRTDVFCTNLRVNVLRKISQHAFVCLKHYAVFLAYFGYISQCLERLKTDIDILNKCLDISVVVTKLKNMLWLSLLWTFYDVFGPFCTMFPK